MFVTLLLFSVFHREIVSEMGEMGVLGPTIKGQSEYTKLEFYCESLKCV